MEGGITLKLFYICLIIISAIILVSFLIWFFQRTKEARIRKIIQSFDVKRITIHHVDKMKGNEFEEYLFHLFDELGYPTALTQNSRDFGADLVFFDRNGVLGVVQAKQIGEPLKKKSNNTIGTEAVQEVFAAKRYYFAQAAYVITNADFTAPCDTLAGYTVVKLINRNDLKEIIHAIRANDYSKAMEIIESEPRQLFENESGRKYSKVNKLFLAKMKARM